MFSKFENKVRKFYANHGRDLPWRKNIKPYHILVSEVMLQQTQVERVRPKYALFLKTFPSFRSLANASTREVLRVWQGLGYNRRALALKRSAEIIVKKYGGRLPDTPELLQAFPGIGRATSGSIVAFAFNKPIPFIETNIRRVFIHFFFPQHKAVLDEDILELVRRTLPAKNPREWYYALMDYGAYLSRLKENPNRKSAHYKKQSRFQGSLRQLRGKLLRIFLERKKVKQRILSDMISEPESRIERALAALIKEGFISRKGETLEVSR